MSLDHPLLLPEMIDRIRDEIAHDIGEAWVFTGFVDLVDRASHPCGVLQGQPIDVFAKLFTADTAHAQLRSERSAVTVIAQHAPQVPVPVVIGQPALLEDGRAVLLLQAEQERPPGERGPADWRGIGRTLAELHNARSARFGLADDAGFYGPLQLPNTGVASNQWADFFRQRRVLPMLDHARRSGHLPPELGRAVERLADRLGERAGPEPTPTLLHGDTQHHNFLSTRRGAVVIDACPYFGHPEVDLAQLDIFRPMPPDVLAGYREIGTIDPSFVDRKELWLIPSYLAVIAVAGATTFGRPFFDRLATALKLVA